MCVATVVESMVKELAQFTLSTSAVMDQSTELKIVAITIPHRGGLTTWTGLLSAM